MAKNACILRVDRIFDGNFLAAGGRDFRCNTGGQVMELQRVRTEISWRFGAPMACDESAPVVPTSVISARGPTILRSDGFAHFRGRMTVIENLEDRPPVLLFAGRLDVIGRIGSHQFLGEACDQREHFEGWLTASGRGRLEGYRLRCVAVGQGTLPEGLVGNTQINRINGTLFLPA